MSCACAIWGWSPIKLTPSTLGHTLAPTRIAIFALRRKWSFYSNQSTDGIEVTSCWSLPLWHADASESRWSRGACKVWCLLGWGCLGRIGGAGAWAFYSWIRFIMKMWISSGIWPTASCCVTENQLHSTKKYPLEFAHYNTKSKTIILFSETTTCIRCKKDPRHQNEIIRKETVGYPTA